MEGAGDSGFLSSELSKSQEVQEELRLRNAELLQQVHLLEAEKGTLEHELALLRQSASQRPAPISSEAEAVKSVSKEAARQRLRRSCQRRSDGSLAVAEDIHEQWKAGGQTRDNLLKVFMENGMNQDWAHDFQILFAMYGMQPGKSSVLSCIGSLPARDPCSEFPNERDDLSGHW